MVTGATGQIGSELVPELSKRYGRDNVVAAGHLRRPTREMEDSGPFITVDLMDLKMVSDTMRQEEIGQVYHLAAMLSAVGEERPQEAWNVNMTSLKNVLDASHSSQVERVFWPSSIAAFGPTSPRNDTPQDTVLQADIDVWHNQGCGRAAMQLLFPEIWSGHPEREVPRDHQFGDPSRGRDHRLCGGDIL